MKLSHEWNPAALLESPLFFPLHPALALLQAGKFPTLADFNAQLATLAIRVKQGHCLRFVAQESGKLGFETQYEPRCYLSGEVQTRADNWHDLFNALVWLSFPKSKAAINARHYQALINHEAALESQRGKIRDMATLFDESGVVVVTADAGLADMLCHFKWKELFWHNRDNVRAAMGFYIFGHGLYEKGLHPYVGMTGQGLVLHVSQDFFNLTRAQQLSDLDERIAAYLDDPHHCLNPRELHPVPLLGIPGWTPLNERADFYDNTAYFRTGRRDAKL
jgi:Protein of unknown function (DUF3025)